MKLKLKLIAVAVAMLAAGGASAALTPATSGNGSFTLYAFNVDTRAYYIRDLGYTLNTFLPSTITTSIDDGGVTGDKTPLAGLTITGGNFSGSASGFSTWLAGQTASSIRWAAVASDSLSDGPDQGGVSRLLTSSAQVNPILSNGTIDNAVSGSNLDSLTSLFGSSTLFKTGTGFSNLFNTNGGTGAGLLSSLDQGVGLYYYSRSSDTDPSGTAAVRTRYGNSPTNFAVVTLGSNGDFSYVLSDGNVSAVPVPAAAWLLGSGLMALGGAARRRKSASNA